MLTVKTMHRNAIAITAAEIDKCDVFCYTLLLISYFFFFLTSTCTYERCKAFATSEDQICQHKRAAWSGYVVLADLT